MQKNFIAFIFFFAPSMAMAIGGGMEGFLLPVKMISTLDVTGVLNANGDISITCPGGPAITGTMIRGTSNAVTALSKPNLFYSTATDTIAKDAPVPFATSFSGNSGDIVSSAGGTVFTVPAAGIYEVSWQIFGEVVGGLPQGYLVVGLTGVDQLYSAIGYASTNGPINGHTLIQALGGDTISIYNRLGILTPAYFGGAGSGFSIGTLMIKRVA